METNDKRKEKTKNERDQYELSNKIRERGKSMAYLNRAIFTQKDVITLDVSVNAMQAVNVHQRLQGLCVFSKRRVEQ